jgi:hypothetical protein
MQMNVEPLQNAGRYSDKWQERFAFFERLESLEAADKKSAVKALPFMKAMRINFNFISFFVGFIYLFVLGMWKRNLAMIAVTFAVYALIIAVAVICDIEISKGFSRGLGIAVSAWYATTVNYAYYLKEVKGYNGWNPFKYS